MPTVLIIDDERSIRNTLKEILSFEGYQIIEAADGKEGLEKFQQNAVDVVLTDIKMPKLDGIEFLQAALQHKTDVPIIMLSGHGTIDTAVQAVKMGAFDFISKPPELKRLLDSIKNALQKTVIETQKKKEPQKKHSTADGGVQIIGESDAIKKIIDTIEKIAPTDARVLITGENGVGKELVARMIHEKSNRRSSQLVEVNCAAIPTELIESELFGHEKGSFTSAVKQRIGKFEQAHTGTLFLDEIGDMNLAAQAKVLRVLQEGKLARVGGEKDLSVNVRVIAATNKNLLEEVEQKLFRLDLYHRLSVIKIEVPPLRERKEDISLLAQHFLKQIANEYQQTEKEISITAIKQLQKMPWHGNIRELRNVMERLFILSGDTITDADVQAYV